MATSALARVSGTVLKSDRRTGTAQGSGREYDFTTVKVLVADSDVTEVTLPDAENLGKIGGFRPERGEIVDWLVEFRLNSSGKSLSGSVLQNFPASASSELLSA